MVTCTATDFSFSSSDVFNARVTISLRYNELESMVYKWWLAQANHIFRRLRRKSNLEEYVVVVQLYYNLEISAPTTEAPPVGFLFLCPEEDFWTGSSVRWPYCPASWSLDPSGVERLSTEEATRLGFPEIQLNTRFFGHYWDTSVYAGLRQFHQARGFDPDSQNVARYLRYRRFKLSSEIDPPFAHVLDALDEGDMNLLFAEDNAVCYAEYPQTSASEFDAGVSLSERNHRDSTISDNELEDIVSSVGDNHVDWLIAGESELPDVEPSVPQDEIVPVPSTHKLLMHIQLALFVFLLSLWLYK
ncbi:hypothetical protein MVEN_02595300 [Mycena venus]|uniref:Uncharacterized protein n=1 Tax=Mycena venus TaxID=2733690 RepID=A0A8H6WT64_9AGAR|nr:hypothetical protein MVEN_02595300 [Mycena venus]